MYLRNYGYKIGIDIFFFVENRSMLYFFVSFVNREFVVRVFEDSV